MASELPSTFQAAQADLNRRALTQGIMARQLEDLPHGIRAITEPIATGLLAAETVRKFALIMGSDLRRANPDVRGALADAIESLVAADKPVRGALDLVAPIIPATRGTVNAHVNGARWTIQHALPFVCFDEDAQALAARVTLQWPAIFEIIAALPPLDITGTLDEMMIEASRAAPGLERGFRIENEASTEQRKDHTYVFHDSGAVIEVRFEEEKGTVNANLGSKYVGKLLEKPNRQISASEFHGSVEASADDDIMDRAAVSDVRQELVDLDTEMAQAERDGDAAALDRLRNEKEELLKQIKSATGAFGKQRRIGAESARSAVAQAIDRFVRKCKRAGLPRFAQHLTDSIAKGNDLAYRPKDPAPDWHF